MPYKMITIYQEFMYKYCYIKKYGVDLSLTYFIIK